MPDKPLSIGFDVSFNEAIKAATDREVVLPDKYYGELQGIARQKAFSIAGVSSLDQLQQVKESLDKAISGGQTFADWKEQAAVMDLGLPKHRLDNIFRTNIQSNYMSGKWEKILRNTDSRPYLMYDAINDSRVRPSHLAMDNTIRRWDDPWWKSHSPPNGYRCRCSIISLTRKQAEDRSGLDKGLNKNPFMPDGSLAEPDKGWDYNPSDRMQGINQALVNKEGKVSDVLFSTLSKKIGEDMHVIKLEGFNVVQEQFAKLAENNPILFNNEMPLIHAVSNDNFFAATDGKDIFISAADTIEKGFIPAVALTEAFNQVSKGRALTFNQEYAVETLQHEILHLTTHKTNIPGRNKGIVVESLVQLLARFTYPTLLENAMGGIAIHQDEIIRGGYGYSYQVTNMIILLSMLEIEKYEFIKYLINAIHSSKNGENLINLMESYIAINSKIQISPNRASELLKLIRNKDGFKELLKNKINY